MTKPKEKEITAGKIVHVPAKEVKNHIKPIIEQITGEYLLQFFEFGHLPAQLQGTAQLFHDQAKAVVASIPANPERTMCLRRLLEAKDCAIRAHIFKK
jgi:ferritin-like protein